MIMPCRMTYYCIDFSFILEPHNIDFDYIRNYSYFKLVLAMALE